MKVTVSQILFYLYFFINFVPKGRGGSALFRVINDLDNGHVYTVQCTLYSTVVH